MVVTPIPTRLTSVRHLPLVSTLCAVAAIVLLNLAGGLIAPTLPNWVGHALSHAVVALPLAALLVTAVRLWPPPAPSHAGVLARRLAIIGYGGLVLGQLLEIIGARVDEPGRAIFEATAHNLGLFVGPLAMLVLLVGATLSVVAQLRARNLPRPLLLLAVVGVIGLAVLLFGLAFGVGID